MTDPELQIWRATYASVISGEIAKWTPLAGFDRALEMTGAELAITIADHAVRELRKWRSEEDLNAGIEVTDE